MHFLLSPLLWTLLLGAALSLSWRRLPRAVRGGGLAGLALALLGCTPLGANALVGMVESSVPAPAACPARGARPAPLIVLSGGLEREPGPGDAVGALSQDSWRRLRGAVVHWKRAGDGLLVLSGGGPFHARESDAMAQLAMEWGVPAASILRERESMTTWESAIALRRVSGLPAQVTVASSALHLPRALLAFRAAGFTPCPLPTHSLQVAPDGWGYLVPQASASLKTQAALHELAGLALYRWRARRPAPG